MFENIILYIKKKKKKYKEFVEECNKYNDYTRQKNDELYAKKLKR